MPACIQVLRNRQLFYFIKFSNVNVYLKKFILGYIGFTLGLSFEHTRPDRDQYIKTGYRKLDASFIDTQGIPYNYASLTHLAGLVIQILTNSKLSNYLKITLLFFKEFKW